MNFSGTQLKYDLRESKVAWARAVPSQHLGDRIENALNAADPYGGQGLDGAWSPLVQHRGEVSFFPELQLPQLNSRLLLFSFGKFLSL